MKEMVLAQYAKYPELGKVKTRIARVLGEEKALDIHMELVTTVLKRFANNKNFGYQLWLSRSNSFSNQELDTRSGKDLQALITHNDVAFCLQSGNDLGERMCNTFRVLASSYEMVSIIGSDCPNVTISDLEAVGEALKKFDVVIIPAEDGGYVLIAMRQDAILKAKGNWLASVAWGTSRAMVETLECCEREGLSTFCLPESWDVDEVEDYERWLSEREKASNVS